MVPVDPNSVFNGKTLVAAPHMDDGVLACGGTIARLADKERIFFVYATDGSRSPVAMFPWQGPASPNLAAIREREARAALSVLGICEDNIHFLGLPDGQLSAHSGKLGNALAELMQEIGPSHVLIPFRYDRHPDHLALHRVMNRVLSNGKQGVSITEYFVYYHWRLIPGRDIRRHIRSDHLLEVDIQTCALKKKKALMCFKSQTTFFFDWQDRPILPERRLDETSQSPELFLRYDPDYPGASVFAELRFWIRLVHQLEPALKQGKEQALALWKTIVPTNGSR